MQSIAGLTATGRKLVGPAADLVELTAENGLRHTAVVFHPEYRGHNAINGALTVVRGYLESPMVTGMVELVAHDSDEGAFVYPTGQTWSVAEVIRTLADLGEPAGIRAGLELMYTAGQILIEAAEVGASEGVYSHGGLTPWRIMLKKDGQVMIIGYALPQAEILQFHEDERRVPREDSFRYCPPERIEAAPEDASSDLFALSLIAFEVMTGKPVYDGLVNDIRQQAARGEGSRRLFRFKDVLPNSVRDLLGRALKPDAEDRFEDGDTFLETVGKVLSGPDAAGMSLVDVMGRISATTKRTGAALQGGKTQMLSKDELVRMLDDDPNNDGRAESDGAEGRRAAKAWSPAGNRRPARRNRRGAAEEPEPAAEPEAPQRGASPSGDGAPEAEGGGQRWSKVSRSRRPRRAARDEAEPDESAAASLQSSGVKAADLLARIRASAEDVSTSGSGERRPGQKDAADVIQEILSSSSRERGNGAKDGGTTADAAEAARSVSRSSKVSRGRVRRGRAGREQEDEALADAGPTPAPTPAPEPEAAPAPTPGRLADSGDVALPPPVDRKDAPPPPSVPGAATRKAPEARPAPEPPAPAEPPPEAPTVTPAPAAAASPPPAATEAPRPAAPPLELGFGDPLARPPDSIRSGAGKGGSAPFTILRGQGGRTVRMRLPLGATVAEAVCWLVGNVVPVRTDLTGRISGWYRVEVEGRRLAPTARLSKLDQEVPLTLVPVPNRTVRVNVVVAVDGKEARFAAPVGAAVPVVSLVDHLVGWLDLGAGSWTLSAGDDLLSPHSILHDLGDRLVPGLTLVLSADTRT